MTDLAVILPAGGSSSRFGRNKLLEPFGGEPVLLRTVHRFEQCEFVKAIFVACSDPETVKSLNAEVQICPGGETRAHSVLSALQRVPINFDWVAIHDAARPFVSIDLITRTFIAAQNHGAAAPAMPVSLTIKQAAGPLPAPVQRTVPRHELWAMQTPQIFRRIELLDAFSRCPIPLAQITDDTQLLELIGKPVMLIPGEESNLKITTTMDLHLAKLILGEGV